MSKRSEQRSPVSSAPGIDAAGLAALARNANALEVSPAAVVETKTEGGKKPKRRDAERIKFTKSELDGLRRTRPHRQRMIWDTETKGLSVLVSRGPKSKRQATVTFRVVYYLRPGKPLYFKIGRYPDDEYTYPYKDENGKAHVIKCSDIDAVRRAASDIYNRAKLGIDPRRPVASDVFEDVVTDFIELHAKNNRSCKETQRIFNTYVLPEWRYLKIGDITREKHITPLLDKIQLKRFKGPKGKLLGGVVTADAVLAQITKLFNWRAARGGFRSPIVKGMRRAPPPKERARPRVLSDQELRVLCPILDEMGTYGAVVKCILLTAQRARKVGTMRRSDVKDSMLIPSHEENGERVPDMRIENVWDPTRDDDPKNKQVSVVPLSRIARQIIDAVPIIDADHRDHEDFVFSVNGRKPLNGWSKYKERLDGKMLAALREQAQQAGQDPDKVELKPWQLRDLRRTARTLMSRAGILTEISERALGHVMTLVRGTYDRYDYLAEKREAFEKLANLIDRIVNPPEGNIILLERVETPAAG